MPLYNSLCFFLLYPVVVVWIGEDKKNKGDVIYSENGDDIE